MKRALCDAACLDLPFVDKNKTSDATRFFEDIALNVARAPTAPLEATLPPAFKRADEQRASTAQGVARVRAFLAHVQADGGESAASEDAVLRPPPPSYCSPYRVSYGSLNTVPPTACPTGPAPDRPPDPRHLLAVSAVPARAAAARHALGGGGVRALAAGECVCVRVSARRRGLLAGERADDVAAQIEDGSYSEREWFRREEANGSNGGREEAAMERSASGLRGAVAEEDLEAGGPYIRAEAEAGPPAPGGARAGAAGGGRREAGRLSWGWAGAGSRGDAAGADARGGRRRGGAAA